MTGLISRKIRLIYIFAFVLAGLLVIFAIRWQVFDASKFKAYAESRFSDSPIKALRGTIYAADGSTLAYSEPRYNVFLWIPEMVFRETKHQQSRDEFIRTIAPQVDTTAEQLQIKIDTLQAQGVKWIKIADKLTVSEQAEMIEKMGEMSGYFFVLSSQRLYPEGQLASQVLGITNVDEQGNAVGLGGIEAAWDGNLEPLAGFVSGDRDARGNAVGIASQRTIEAERGNAIYTSIDKKLQQIVEEKLAWAVENYGADSGTVIILEPKTGRIMSMANFPTFDANTREVNSPDWFGNKAVSEPFEVGSVGKIFTLAAAIDQKTVTPDTVIMQGHEGCEKIHEDLEPVCTHDHLPQPPLPIKEAFALSDNLYFYHLAEMMYNQDQPVFYDYLDKFGIGKATGVDISGESYGYLKNWQSWNVADIAAYSYGHSYQVNALQAVSAVGALANYGVRMQPQIVTKVVKADGKEIDFQPVPLAQVVSKEATQLMDEMMFQVYKNNIFWWEHHYDHLRDYKIAMKSGTALIPFRDRAGYSTDINATYVGYDASPDRSFVMLTRLERPRSGNLASHNSRVLWLEIFAAMKDYLGVRRIGEY